MTLVADWSYPTAIRFGAGRLQELPNACANASIRNPLFITDRGLAALPLTRQALDILESAGLGRAIFSDVDPNPSNRNLDAGLVRFRDGGHDGVVAFGGGSGLDLGKAVAFMSGQSRPVWDFEDIGDWWRRANPDGIAPVVAIPTTAGTGSEVGRSSVIVNADTRVKKIIFHPRVLPTVAIIDPELTVGLPGPITAGTGMDAFAHCLEAYCSPHYHPMGQGIALEGMRLVHENLQNAYADGSDLEARANMMAAATMGAVAFQKGLGAIHALSNPVGAVYDTHHGTTNACVMPHVLDFNRSAVTDRLASSAAYLGLRGGYAAFYDRVMELRESLGIPQTLSEMGVGHDRLDELTAMALEDPSAGGNPVPMTEANTRALFEACM